MTNYIKARETVQWILESIPDAIVVVDNLGRILLVNAQTEKLFGYAREELSGQLIEILVPHRFRGKHAAYRADYFMDLKVRTMGSKPDLCGLRKDGSEFSADISLSPIWNEGEYLVVCAVRDVTEHLQLIEQLNQAQKMHAIGRLAGGVAHDFNNLLTIILGYCELLQGQFPPDGPVVRAVEGITKAGKQAASLTQQLLAFSRQQVLQPRVLDLNTVVTEVVKMLQRLIGEDIHLVAALDSGLGRVMVDPGQMEQVILNLAVNARDAMPRGGTLTIETRNVILDETYTRQHLEVKPGPYVMLAVSDTGSGMNLETQSHIFEPFFTTKAKGKGTGLGLATVYGIVKQSGGDIWIYSEPGQGTTFKIYLPCTEQVEGLSAPPHTGALHGTETILLVEDNEDVQNLIRQALQGCGYTVLAVRDGLQAIDLVRGHTGTIHLLLTDVVMPHMSGRELAEALTSRRPEMHVLYVLYMSGYTNDAIIHHGVLEPGTAFIPKPFAPTDLAFKVRAVLDA